MEGKRKLGWAVKYSREDGSVVHLAYNGHDTPEEAIRAYESAMGTSWAEAKARGAVLVRQEIVEVQKPGSKEK